MIRRVAALGGDVARRPVPAGVSIDLLLEVLGCTNLSDHVVHVLAAATRREIHDLIYSFAEGLAVDGEHDHQALAADV
jgi:hypothetical protein